MPESVRDEKTLLEYAREHRIKTLRLGSNSFGRGLYAFDIPAATDAAVLAGGGAGDASSASSNGPPAGAHGEGPPILITAGSHATEPAGVLAALQMARDVRCSQRVVIMPLRDPVGWEGYATYLALALGEDAGTVAGRFSDHASLRELLVTAGEAVWDDSVLTIADVGGTCFVTMPVAQRGRGPMDIWKQLHGLLDSHPELVDRLKNKRLVLPENLPDVEGCGVYDHAFTAWVTPEGGVGNFNRLFSMSDAPAEVAALAELTRELQPGLVVDLHESQGRRFSIFAHPEVRPGASEVYFGATGAVYAGGYAIESLANLAGIIGADHAARFRDHGGGVISGLNEFPGQGWQFTNFAARMGAVTVTTEPGRWQPLAARVRQQVLATRGAIFAYLNRGAIHGN